MNEEKGRLKIIIKRSGSLNEFISFFEDLENAYNHLYFLGVLIDDAKILKENEFSKNLFFRKFRFSPLYHDFIPNVEEVVLPNDRIHLNSIVVESPGWAEFFASLNPLETLRKYLNDRYERRKDREWREDAEKKSFELDNKIKEAQYIQEVTKALKEIGYTEIEIRKIINEHYHDPLSNLDKYQDSDLIEASED